MQDDACRRDKAGNRLLHFDQYCLLTLLSLFNPVVTSLRSIQQASAGQSVQMKLGLRTVFARLPIRCGSVFAADPLKEIIDELGQQLPPLGHDKRLTYIPLTLTLVDGTLLSALLQIRKASGRKKTAGSGLLYPQR